MEKKVRGVIQKGCDALELLVAVAVGMGLIVSLILYIPDGVALLTKSGSTSTFLQFLEDMFSVVVGIEFIKMLCKPSAENVIEVLVFLVARHMIIGSSTALDILLSVVSVVLLYAVRLVLRREKQKFLEKNG